MIGATPRVTTADDGREAPGHPSSSPNFRIQCAMVLFSLEQSLGQYITEIVESADEIPEGIRKDIVGRRTIKADDALSIERLVAETYISETIDIAVSTSAHRADKPHLERLKKLVADLHVFDIRNAICHPNRPFPECYWYRMAVVATDPSIEALGLKRVVAAFRSAVEGQIVPPPESWLSQCAWAVPNNLPDRFDHEITGLIDRSRDSLNLLKLLKNPRYSLIAVVGPGGNGKTALCLDVLRDCSLDPETLKWTDEIVYLSAKTERLTSLGLEKITNPVDSIDLVKESIATFLASSNDLPDSYGFLETTNALRDRRVLLCLDNLETLVREHQREFEEFVANLPPSWRVLVTSRVSVNSASVLPIEGMSPSGAKKLAREYLTRRGGHRLPEERLEALATASNCNPLAIRLVIDSYLAGAELEAALKQTKDSIIAFSYTSLLDALPSVAIDVLECLFSVPDPIARSDIAYLLELDADAVSEALSQVLRTSLVTRHSDNDVERYSLSSSRNRTLEIFMAVQ